MSHTTIDAAAPKTANPIPTQIARGRLSRLRWNGLERYVRTRLLWHRIYRAMSYARSALWIAPLFALVLVLASAPVIRMVDDFIPWKFAGLGVDGAKALLNTVITLTLSFLVFTFGSLLVAIQIAGGQLTPRIIATTLLRDNVVRASVGLFVFTLIFSVMALDRLEDKVHDLVGFIAALLGIACMAMFLVLIDYAARLLRPVSILARIGDSGLHVIESVYPAHAAAEEESVGVPVEGFGGLRRVMQHAGRSEIVLAVDLETLVSEARRACGVIEFVPQVGDFVADEEPLFALYGGATRVADRTLAATVAFGPERTLEQDPMFALRIMVDIALKALSPAINDPTTAVLAIDQIHRFLRAVGRRQLRGEVIRDDAGTPRVIYRTPNWDDFVHVACNEIRACGASNIQVARRMRAMLENLQRSLPPYRQAPLVQECAHLDTAIDQAYGIPADRELARLPDLQGLGGSTSVRSTSPD